jgi:hypothetical protein
MDGKFNFVSIACAGQYVNVNQIDEAVRNFCFRRIKPEQREEGSNSLPARN